MNKISSPNKHDGYKNAKFVNDENLKAFRISPQKRHLQTSSAEGIAPQCCVRLTISICVFGATLGFCLLVAGGVGLNQLGNIKVLMYVGILIFLVCVILLIILCSSYEIFNINPVLENKVQQKRRFDHYKYNIQDDKILFIDDHPVPCVFSHACHHHHLPSCHQTPIQNDVINANRKVETLCTVKNCACLLKNCENQGNLYEVKANHEELYDVPYIFDNMHTNEFCSYCHQARTHFPKEEFFFQEAKILPHGHYHHHKTKNTTGENRDLLKIVEEIPVKRIKKEMDNLKNIEERTSKV